MKEQVLHERKVVGKVIGGKGSEGEEWGFLCLTLCVTALSFVLIPILS